jgi:hypothetical protein
MTEKGKIRNLKYWQWKWGIRNWSMGSWHCMISSQTQPNFEPTQQYSQTCSELYSYFPVCEKLTVWIYSTSEKNRTAFIWAELRQNSLPQKSVPVWVFNTQFNFLFVSDFKHTDPEMLKVALICKILSLQIIQNNINY